MLNETSIHSTFRVPHLQFYPLKWPLAQVFFPVCLGKYSIQFIMSMEFIMSFLIQPVELKGLAWVQTLWGCSRAVEILEMFHVDLPHWSEDHLNQFRWLDQDFVKIRKSCLLRGKYRKEMTIKGNKTIISISTKPATEHQSSKGHRVIATTDYLNTAALQSYFILAMCLIPFRSLNGPSDWLSVLFWKRPTKLLERPPSLSRPVSLPCQSAILFPDSTVISQPSGAALLDLCLDLRLNRLSSSTSFSLESRLGPPLLIYEPFHTVLLPLETQPWPTLHGTLLALNT